MPLHKLLLILIAVIAAAGLTVWVGRLAADALQLPGFAWMFFLPAALIGYAVWRLIASRMVATDKDHHDTSDK